eukprot:4392067-Pyramimonas_sp.AAC.1
MATPVDISFNAASVFDYTPQELAATRAARQSREHMEAPRSASTATPSKQGACIIDLTSDDDAGATPPKEKQQVDLWT